MQNRLVTEEAEFRRSPERWDADHRPGLRLLFMWAAMLCGMLAVGLRLAHLQLVLQSDFVDGFDQTYEIQEAIPARSGRILAVDGTVLAGEEPRYDLQVHYRLIQQTPDPRWLRSEALRQLSSRDRRQPERVSAAQQEILDRHNALWQVLARLVGRSQAELEATRKQVEQRVARIRVEVEQRRRQRVTPEPEPTGKVSGNALSRFWSSVTEELTRTPRRSFDAEPLVEEVGFHTVAADVSPEVRAEIEAHPARYPGVRIFVQSRRIYPRQDLASHLLGSRTSVTAEEVAESAETAAPAATASRPIRESRGRSGLERTYDEHLSGISGLKRMIRNRRGEVIRSEVIREPRHGRDLVVTLDVAVQQRAESLLDDALTTVTPAGAVDDQSTDSRSEQPTCPQGGCVVAMDIHSGAILAAAAAPRFDLNLLIQPDPDRWQTLLDDPRKPLFPRVTHMALAPGSVFKPIVAIAGMQSGVLDPDLPVLCHGYLDRPDQHRCLIYRHHRAGHGELGLAGALCRSCNVYFFKAARAMGPQALVDWSRRFGIGEPTGIDLPSESSGHLPSPEETVKGVRRKWYPGDTLGLSIGQADLLVTPLQMVRVMAALANGGRLVTPHLASSAGPSRLGEASTLAELGHNETRPIPDLAPEALAHVQEGLEMVVNHPAGTAHQTVFLREVRIAGKTGTAESQGVDHAWFAGYAPAEQPRIAFVVVLEQGGSGGKAAGPLARKLVQTLAELGLIGTPTNLVQQGPASQSQ